jgi:hypothetical protein
MTARPDHPKTVTLPCVECRAKCCRYVGVEIDPPTSKRDFDTIRWYLLHKHVNVYIDHDNDWFVEFETVCEELLPDFGCRRYDIRPQLCREHGWPAGSCEFFAVPHRHLFRTAREFETYLEKRGIDWQWKRRPPVDQEGEAQ